MNCEFFIAPDLPYNYNVDDIRSYGNLNDSGDQITCHLLNDQCMALWAFDELSNATNFLLKGCWKGNGDCAKSECISVGNIPNTVTNMTARFCCCSSPFCNHNVSSVPKPKTILASQIFGPVVRTLDYSTIFYTSLLFACLFLLILLIILLRHLYYSKLQYKKSIDNQDQLTLLPVDRKKSILARQLDFKQYQWMNPNTLQYTDISIRGEMSTVRQAYCNDNPHKLFMVKTYNENRKENFDDELTVLVSLRKFEQENLLKMVGWFTTKNPDYCTCSILMPYYSGGTLRDFLKGHTLDSMQICYLARSIVRGLAFLHGERGEASCSDAEPKPQIAHRNLSSQNILMKDENTCLIAGFSCAMILDDAFKSKKDLTQSALKLPKTDSVQYWAPELLERTLSDFETALRQIDVYAMSLILWEMASRLESPNTPGYSMPFGKELESAIKRKKNSMVVIGPSYKVDDKGLQPDQETENEEWNGRFIALCDIVAKQRRRPIFPDVFGRRSIESLNRLKSLIEDCWDHDPDARITVFTAQERLQYLFDLETTFDSLANRDGSSSPDATNGQQNVTNLANGGLQHPPGSAHYDSSAATSGVASLWASSCGRSASSARLNSAQFSPSNSNTSASRPLNLITEVHSVILQPPPPETVVSIDTIAKPLPTNQEIAAPLSDMVSSGCAMTSSDVTAHNSSTDAATVATPSDVVDHPLAVYGQVSREQIFAKLMLERTRHIV